MKIKTWEKWYWGIDLAIMILALIGYHTNDNPKNYTMTINGETRPATATEVYIGALIVFVGIAGLLWLIIRYLDILWIEETIKNKSDKWFGKNYL